MEKNVETTMQVEFSKFQAGEPLTLAYVEPDWCFRSEDLFKFRDMGLGFMDCGLRCKDVDLGTGASGAWGLAFHRLYFAHHRFTLIPRLPWLS